jgi:hypothetical protein
LYSFINKMVFSLEHDIKVTTSHQNLLPTQSVIVVHTVIIYEVSVKSEILFCKWGRLGNERSELTNPTNKIKLLLTRPSYIYFLYNWFALH